MTLSSTMRMWHDACGADHDAGKRGVVEGEHDAPTVSQTRSRPEAIAASNAWRNFSSMLTSRSFGHVPTCSSPGSCSRVR
jgi:hypothetical protein